MNVEDIRRDISAFSDEEEAVALEVNTGELLFKRLGTEYECKLRRDPSGGYVVEYGGLTFPYRKFLAREVARLDVMAERIIARRPSLAGAIGKGKFVNGPADLDSAISSSQKGKALELLDSLCRSPAFATTRVVFVTADAGFGKTALLREYQRTIAEKFLEGESEYLFWHVDLQGRQLVRLSEALMGDLGDLRVVGLYMASIVTLVRHGLLVLAIDGFDELAAEQGTTEALGALAHLLERLSGGGTVVAASRRSFFNADDYIEGAHLLGSKISPRCEFDHLRLLDWSPVEAVELLDGMGIVEPDSTYVRLRQALGQAADPVLETPFLLSETAKALRDLSLTPEAWIEGLGGDAGGMAGMVDAFLQREVFEKWKTQEGAPLLSLQQHRQLLAAIAEEMWMSQIERLDLQTIQILAEILFDQWELRHESRSSLMEMLRMHVFLIPAYEAGDESRMFPHPEYLRFFEATALYDHLSAAVRSQNTRPLARFLSAAQLPDAVARHTSRLVRAHGISAEEAIATLSRVAEIAWKPSNLQVSMGTLIPQLLSGSKHETCTIDINAVYPRMALEGTQLHDVTFRSGQFVRCSISGVVWKSVTFNRCQLIEPVIEDSSLENVRFIDCTLAGVVVREGGEETIEYAPVRVLSLLRKVGIRVETLTPTPSVRDEAPSVDSPGRRALMKILRIYRRTTGLSEGIIQLKFGRDHTFITQSVLPLMEEYGLVERDTWEGAGRPQKRWLLRIAREDLLRSDRHGSDLVEFWKRLDALHS